MQLFCKLTPSRHGNSSLYSRMNTPVIEYFMLSKAFRLSRQVLAVGGLTAILGAATSSNAQVQLVVDPSLPWQGYMNVFSLPADGGGYQFGGPWGAGDLRAAFANDVLGLQACTNVSNPADSYWTKPDGSGNKQMQANWYVDTVSLVGSNLVFSGNVVDDSLTGNQACQAFIKVFPSDYSSVLQQSVVPLTGPNQFFSVSLTATNPGAAHVQYGFATVAPNAPWTSNPDSTASITIRTNSLDPLNVLVNPGFESGLTAWNAYGNGGNIESAANAYYNGGNPVGASNVLVYGGTKVQKVFPTFTGGPNYSGIYQDVATGGGSVWQATGRFLTHQQDQIGVWSGTASNQCWLEVTFRDSGNGVLATYQSQIIDNSSPTNVWLDMRVTDGAGGIALTAPGGTAKVRFQEVYYQPSGYAGGSVYADAMVLDNLSPSDPNVTVPPANQTVLVGQTATLKVTASGGTTLHYQWQRSGTNIVDGGNIVGATAATLRITNAQKADAGVYTVTVSDTAGSLDSTATLTVKTADEAANLLENPGFETGTFSPWTSFNGAGLRDGPTLQIALNISLIDGNYAAIVYNGGEYDGAYQDVPVTPGQIVAADGQFLVSSSEPLAATITCWLEVQFLKGGTPLALYKSATINGTDFTAPIDTWFALQATNGFAGDFNTPIPNAQYLTVPAGATTARYQVTMHSLGGGGSVYFDAMRLLKKDRAPLTVSRTGNNLTINWPTQGAATYQVVYKDSLNATGWTSVGAPIAGDGSVKSVSYPISGAKRFYAVLTQ